MIALAPSQTQGIKFQHFKTVVIARSNLFKGELAAFTQPTKVDGYMEDVYKVDSRDLLNNAMCVMLENAVAGQQAQALITGPVFDAWLCFKNMVKHGAPLVANLIGGLTPDGDRGDRILAYSRCTLATKPETGKSYGGVFFNGFGFGPLQ